MWGRWGSGWAKRTVLHRAMPACLPAQSVCHISLRLRSTVCYKASNSHNLILTLILAPCAGRATFRSKQVSGRRWMAPDGEGEADGPPHVQSYVFPS